MTAPPAAPASPATDVREQVAMRIFDGLWRAWATYGLAATLFAIHIFVGLHPYYRGRWSPIQVLIWPRGTWLLARFGSMRSKAVDRGELWRLVSAGFLHVDGLHFAVNLVGLLLVGRVVEAVFGPARTIALFVIATMGGTTLSWLVGGTASSVGASGGIFGLMGAAVYFGWTRASDLPDDVSRVLKRRLTIIVVLNLLIGLPISVIDNHAHVGGLLAGVAAAIPMGDRVTGTRPQSARATWMLIAFSTLAIGWAAAGVWTRY